MKLQTAVIVLAAGRGSRFVGPQHKLTQPLGAGTVLGQTILHAIESHLPVIVVTTERLAAEAARWVARRDLVVLPEVGSSDPVGPTTVAANPGPHVVAKVGVLGMGYSIAAGVAARPQAHGWLVLPGDMPLVRPATLLTVANGLANNPVVYAQHRGRRGHPVGFGAELFSELVQLTGDEGARRLSARYPSAGLEVDDPGVLIDVDTEADLAAVRRALKADRAGQPALPRG